MIKWKKEVREVRKLKEQGLGLKAIAREMKVSPEKISYWLQKEKKENLRKRADNLWHRAIIKKWGNECFFHKYPSKQAKVHSRLVNTGHHFKPKSVYGNLRYDLDNGVPICWPCHYKMEKIDRSMIADIIMVRGKEWYDRLEKKSRERKRSYQTITYYESVIKELEDYLNKND